MTAYNLAVCFAPSLFQLNNGDSLRNATSPRQRRKTGGKPDQKELIENVAANECLALMIRECKKLFMVRKTYTNHNIDSSWWDCSVKTYTNYNIISCWWDCYNKKTQHRFLLVGLFSKNWHKSQHRFLLVGLFSQKNLHNSRHRSLLVGVLSKMRATSFSHELVHPNSAWNNTIIKFLFLTVGQTLDKRVASSIILTFPESWLSFIELLFLTDSQTEDNRPHLWPNHTFTKDLAQPTIPY